MIRIVRSPMQNRRPFNVAIAVTMLLLVAYRGVLAQDTAGIGVALSRDSDHVIIGKLLPDGSAATSGKLSVGDWIIALSDESIPDTDVSNSSIDAVVALMRGRAGSTIRITVVPQGKTRENAFTVPLTRGTIPILEKWGDGRLISAGKEFPKVEMTMLDGTDRILKSSDLQGRIVVFEVWSTWCGPCLRLMADHQELAAEHASLSKKLAFVGASIDDKPELALEQLKNRNWNATTNVWLNDVAIKALHIKSVPVAYLIDAEGNVLANSDEENFSETLDATLQGLQIK